MGKILIFSEMFEIRELIAQDLADEGHMVVATGNPALIRTLVPDFNPDVTLLDLHPSKVSPWEVMELNRKKSLRVIVLPFTATANAEGNIRLVIPRREGGENLSFQDFNSKVNTPLNPRPFAGERLSPQQAYCPES